MRILYGQAKIFGCVDQGQLDRRRGLCLDIVRERSHARIAGLRFHDLRQHAESRNMPNLHRMTATGGARAVF